jgi:hypothetical protein
LVKFLQIGCDRFPARVRKTGDVNDLILFRRFYYFGLGFGHEQSANKQGRLSLGRPFPLSILSTSCDYHLLELAVMKMRTLAALVLLTSSSCDQKPQPHRTLKAGLNAVFFDVGQGDAAL